MKENSFTLASMTMVDLLERYEKGLTTPAEEIKAIYNRCEQYADHNIWITRLPLEQVLERAAELEAMAEVHPFAQLLERFPLFGLPFAVKDNFDVADLPTTAGCPAYAFQPPASATVVDRLLSAGAILVGKTNMDQFATGLVGTRSPYGPCRNAYQKEYISGGSSSGSAVAVALGLVSFSLGTDTAGSGRVPAGFNNIVGLKPTRGAVSNAGVVPACRSLDCPSVFALTCQDADRVYQVIRGEDPRDCFTRKHPEVGDGWKGGAFRFGLPAPLTWFDNGEMAELFERAVQRLKAMGGVPVELDYTPFRDAAALLYEGPWVAERTAALEDFVTAQPEAVDPVVGPIIAGGRRYSAMDVFRSQYRLQELQKQTAWVWADIDILVVPTVPVLYTIDQVMADPLETNRRLGVYTNFVNLLDLAAVAVPSEMASSGVPVGITLIGPSFSETMLLSMASVYHAKSGLCPKDTDIPSQTRSGEDLVPVVVVGAHMRGLALNHQLTDLGGRYVGDDVTSSVYRLFLLEGSAPLKPGLVRVPDDGAAIELEVWEMPASVFGTFVAQIPSPLAMGNVQLRGGRWVKGFVCESWAVQQAPDITAHGGFRAYLKTVDVD